MKFMIECKLTRSGQCIESESLLRHSLFAGMTMRRGNDNTHVEQRPLFIIKVCDMTPFRHKILVQ